LDLTTYRFRSDPRPAFEDDSETRHLRIAIDERLLHAAQGSEVAHLLQFAKHPLVELASLEYEKPGVSLLPSRLIIKEPDVGNDMVPLSIIDQEGSALAAILYFTTSQQTAQQLSQRFKRDREKLLAEVLRAEASMVWPADLLVTEWDVLLKTELPVIRQANPMPPAEALALLGLFLRHRDDYTWGTTPDFGFRRLPRNNSYTFASRSALSSGWSYWACVHEHTSVVAGRAELALLAETVFRRVERALIARDHIMVQLQQRHGFVAEFELLYHLDSYLVQLVGAFDALARAADVVVGLGTDPIRVGWQSEDWCKTLIDQVEGFRTPLRGDAEDQQVLQLLYKLRNNIHGDILRIALPQRSDAPTRFSLRSPGTDQQWLWKRVSTTAMKGPQSWGMEMTAAGDVVIDIALFIERMTQAVVRVANNFMDLTPVSELPGVQAASKSYLPASEDPLLGAVPRAALPRIYGLA
jgi:hypothetical protein